MKSTEKWIGALLILCCVVFGSTQVSAYVSEGPCVDIDNSNLKVSGFISSSEIDYEFEVPSQGNGDIEVERKIIGFNVTKRINTKLDAYGALGYLFDGSIKPEGDDDSDLDSGYFLSAGVRYMIHQSDSISFHLFGQLDYILNEEYSDLSGVGFDFELNGYEISLGGAARFQINDKFSAFAGISFVPLSNTSYDLSATGIFGSRDWDGDVERDDELGFKAGASYLIDNHWSIRGEADFVSDKAFLVSASLKF